MVRGVFQCEISCKIFRYFVHIMPCLWRRRLHDQLCCAFNSGSLFRTLFALSFPGISQRPGIQWMGVSMSFWWCSMLTAVIHSKNCIKDNKNYRLICLLSNMYKLFTKIMTTMLEKKFNENQPREQAVFPKKKLPLVTQ